jgi:hypothetical protein
MELTPFSNAIEAMSWINSNCDKCTKKSCNTKKIIKICFITGTVSKYIAEKIGFIKIMDSFVTLRSRCQMYAGRQNKIETTGTLF